MLTHDYSILLLGRDGICKRQRVRASSPTPKFVHLEQDRDILSRYRCCPPTDGGSNCRSFSDIVLYFDILIDDVGHTLCNAIEDWSIASYHDSRFLRCLHLRVCCGFGNNSLNFPANAERGRRLRLYAEAERRMWVEFEGRWQSLTSKHLVNFAQWAALVLCQVCGILLNDRVPLWISGRRGGAWHLEYRLYPILIVAAASPIGFGIFGAGIQYALFTLPARNSQLTYQGIIATTWYWLSPHSSSFSARVTVLQLP